MSQYSIALSTHHKDYTQEDSYVASTTDCERIHLCATSRDTLHDSCGTQDCLPAAKEGLLIVFTTTCLPPACHRFDSTTDAICRIHRTTARSSPPSSRRSTGTDCAMSTASNFSPGRCSRRSALRPENWCMSYYNEMTPTACLLVAVLLLDTVKTRPLRANSTRRPDTNNRGS